MTTRVETLPADGDDPYLMDVRVRTVDAVGAERRYEIGITETGKVNGQHVMQSKRVDEDAPDEPAGGGASQRAYEAAAKRFEAAGYEVFGHD